MEELITVIIPVYNKEKYIKKTMDSIMNQTYKNLEIIIINDGSTDNSRNVCEEFARKDKRIILINTENHGAGHARNLGIKRAKGKYISFIDADDYIDKDYYKILYNMIVQNNADMAECRYLRVAENEDKTVAQRSGTCRVISNIEELKILYGKDIEKYTNAVIMCNKLFKSELLDDTYYPENRKIDDEFITYKLIYKSKKIAVTDDILYYYVQGNDSVMRNDFKEKRVIDTIDVYDEVYEFVKKNQIEELYDLVLIRYIFYCLELIQKTKKSNDIEDKQRVLNFIYKKFEEKKNIIEEKYNENDWVVAELRKFEKEINTEIKEG